MKDGFYWARFKDDGSCTIVEVADEQVFMTGSEDIYGVEHFGRFADLVSTEPLTPPVSK